MKVINANYCVFLSLLLLGCIHPQPNATESATDEPTKPLWLNQDCFKLGEFYFFVGFGKGADASSAIRSALVSSRKNALTCVFGGAISSNIEVSESNNNVEYTGKTVIELNYDHVNWAGYEQVPGRVYFPTGDDHQVYSQYRWKLKQISDEQVRLKNLARKIEENKALKKEVELSKVISTEKENLIKEQKAELDKLKQHEREVANLRSNKARVLAKLEKMKKQRSEKGNEFVELVTSMGCDVTYDDLVELIGKPDSIEMRGICYEACNYRPISKWIPVIVYRYGSYAINAYIQGTSMEGSSDWDSYKKYKSDIQIVDIEKAKGTKQRWWICQKGYDFVKRLTGSNL